MKKSLDEHMLNSYKENLKGLTTLKILYPTYKKFLSGEMIASEAIEFYRKVKGNKFIYKFINLLIVLSKYILKMDIENTIISENDSFIDEWIDYDFCSVEPDLKKMVDSCCTIHAITQLELLEHHFLDTLMVSKFPIKITSTLAYKKMIEMLEDYQGEIKNIEESRKLISEMEDKYNEEEGEYEEIEEMQEDVDTAIQRIIYEVEYHSKGILLIFETVFPQKIVEKLEEKLKSSDSSIEIVDKYTVVRLDSKTATLSNLLLILKGVAEKEV